MSILKIESGNFATSITTATLSQNRTITLPNASGELTLRSQLATVATTGSYNDLSNKPSFPATPKAYVTQTWRSGASWYRRWSNGWIEQGGVISKAMNGYATISFHTKFSSTQYSIIGAGGYSSPGDSFDVFIIASKPVKPRTSVRGYTGFVILDNVFFK